MLKEDIDKSIGDNIVEGMVIEVEIKRMVEDSICESVWEELGRRI
jgi:hypothetical protein